jgi:16S rRNA G966 N2-methylase RsmD
VNTLEGSNSIADDRGLTLAKFPRTLFRMAKKVAANREGRRVADPNSGTATRRPSPLLDTRVVYCGDNLEQLAKLPEACVDLIYIDPPFNSNRNYEVFLGETKEKRAFADRHESTRVYID